MCTPWGSVKLQKHRTKQVRHRIITSIINYVSTHTATESHLYRYFLDIPLPDNAKVAILKFIITVWPISLLRAPCFITARFTELVDAQRAVKLQISSSVAFLVNCMSPLWTS
jgi:hypothetical protein